MGKLIETWRDVPGYEGLYMVSDWGNVMSLHGRGGISQRVLKQANDSQGYKMVSLSKGGKEKTVKVHRIVAEAFLRNPNNLPQINHIDECKDHNCIYNIEFCSSEYNINWGTRNLKVSVAMSKPVVQLDMDGNFVRRWGSASEAELKGGYNHGTIASCCLGIRKIHHGSQWCYESDYKERKFEKVCPRNHELVQLDMEGNLIRKWHSAKEAEREGGFQHGLIMKCCRGEYSQHKGYRWEFA